MEPKFRGEYFQEFGIRPRAHAQLYTALLSPTAEALSESPVVNIVTRVLVQTVDKETHSVFHVILLLKESAEGILNQLWAETRFFSFWAAKNRRECCPLIW